MTLAEPQLDVEKLQSRLSEAEETLRAIRGGQVDAVVVSGAKGDQVFVLKGAEQPYRVFLETMKEGALTLLADATIAYSNRRFAEMLRVPLEQVIGASLAQFAEPAQKPRLDSLFRQAMAGDAEGVIQFTPPGGPARWIELSMCSVKLDVAAGVCVLANDITERRKNAELRSYLAAIVDSSDDAIVGKDLDGTILSWNRGAEILYGYTAKEALGKPITILEPSDAPSEIGHLLDRIRRGERVDHFQTLRIRKDGARVPVTLAISPILSNDGQIIGASSIARDISELKQAEAALRRASAYNRSLIEASLDPLVTISPDGIITDVNQATERVTGRPRKELIGSDFSTYFTDPDKARQGYLKAFRDGSVRNYELEITDGTVTPVIYNASIYRDEDGKVAGVFAAARDITERKIAEAARQESETAFRTLVDAVPQMVWMCTPDGLNTYFSQQWADYTGLTLQESYGKGWYTPFHPDDKQAAWDGWNHSTQTGEIYRIESRLRAADGSYRWFLMRGVPMRNPEGHIVKWFGTCTDIDDLKQAEEKLNRLNRELRTVSAYTRSLIEASLDPLVTISPEGKITDVNEATETATGLSRHALFGTDFCDYFTDPEKARDGYKHVFKEGWTRDYELEIRHRGGSTMPVLYNASIYRDESGKTVGIFAAARNVTELKRAEKQITELNADLERRVEERTSELVAANKELEAFSYSVSHDLRAPLRSMDGFCQALVEDYSDKLDFTGKDYLQRVRAASQRMDKLIDGMLMLSRTSRAEMRRVPVDMSNLAQTVALELQKTSATRHVEFVIASGLSVNADATLLRTVLENLLGNAWKFSAKHPQARIELGQFERDGETVYFVRDDGAGYDIAYAKKLFGVFQRLHTSEEFEGTGVGLANVQRIIRRHGGIIWAEGQVEKGATFYFTIPSSPTEHETR